MSSNATAEEKISPMMMQWHECKKKAEGSLLLFRLGDFYESFYTDATLLAKELDLTLTKRGEIPMAGIPFHTSETYIDRLVSKGYRVAIAEQIEDPKVVKGLVKREIVRIVTPGTLVNSSLLSDKSNNFIASCALFNQVFGLSILDVTTAELKVIEFETLASLFDEISRVQPKEILLSEKLLAQDPEIWNDLKQQINTSLVVKEPWSYDPELTVNFLIGHFQILSLDSFGVQEMSAALHAAGCLLSYVKETLNLPIDHIQTLQKELSNQYMCLDSVSLRHLEIIESLHEKQNGASLLSLIDHTKTPMGGRLLKHWLTHPLINVAEIQKRQKAIASFISFEDSKKLKILLSEIKDLERLIMKAETGFANPKDLFGLKISLKEIPSIFSIAQEIKDPFLQSLVENLQDVSEILLPLEEALSDDPPFRLSDGGAIKVGFHPELDELRQICGHDHRWIADYQASLREQTQIKTLKVGFTKAFGYYIEVSRGQAEKMPETFQRRQTLLNAERFITPELKAYEHKVLSAEDKISSLESKLFQELRMKVAAHGKKVRTIAYTIAQIDVLLSLSQTAIEQSYICPTVDESSVLEIKEGRHPVIEANTRLDSFIPNDTFLDCEKQRLFVITGPNMAGKSTFIRQVALIVILAQIGSFVPAQTARIGIVDKVFTRIGASDNISKGQSTFMVEMTETANILHNVTSRSLVILDEIGRGTSTYDGISIAWAVAEYLLTTPGKQAKTLFATHYCELTALESKIPGAVNYNVAIHESDKGIVFLRKIIRGGTDKSYGIHVAKLAGLPPFVLKKANELLKSLEKGAGPKPVEKKEEQLSLFSTLSREEEEVLKKLRSLDLNNLTPIQSLQTLFELKNKLF